MKSVFLTEKSGFSNFYTSILPKSLGGSIGLPIENHVFYFQEDESFFGEEKYAFLYLVNNISKNASIKSFKISAYFDTTEHVDKFNQIFLANLHIEIIDATIFGKNAFHLTYNEFGYILDLDDYIDNYKKTPEIKNSVYIEETLQYGDFYPFAIKVKISNPIERVEKLPIILKASYVLM